MSARDVRPSGLRPRHLLLVRAACGPADDAREAWRAWRRQTRPDRADGVEWPLLPWLSSRAEELDIAQADRVLLHSMRQYVWMENQSRLNAAAALAAILAAEGMTPLFVKGLPLMATVYGDIGWCRLVDVDWQLPADQVAGAARLLGRHGWGLAMPVRRQGQVVLEPRELTGLGEIHHMLRPPGGGSVCELHWNLLRFPVPAVDEGPLFAAAETLAVRGRNVLMPCATDLLLQVLVRGYSRERWFRALRWTVDSCLLVRHRKIDWDRLTAESIRRGVGPMVADAGRFLNRVSPGLFPDPLLQQLARRMDGPLARGRHLYLSGDWRLARQPAYLVECLWLIADDWQQRMRRRRVTGMSRNPITILSTKTRRGLRHWWETRIDQSKKS